MITPQEILQRRITKATFGGYNITEVDQFLEDVSREYGALYKENALLKQKMRVLTDKLEEYQANDEALRKTMMTAQRLADEMEAKAKADASSVLLEAEARKQELLAQVEAEVASQVLEIRKAAEAEQFRLIAAQNATALYVSQIKELCRKELEYLGNLAQVFPTAFVGGEAPSQVATVAPVAEQSPVPVMEPVAVAAAAVAPIAAVAVEEELADLGSTQFSPSDSVTTRYAPLGDTAEIADLLRSYEEEEAAAKAAQAEPPVVPAEVPAEPEATPVLEDETSITDRVADVFQRPEEPEEEEPDETAQLVGVVSAKDAIPVHIDLDELSRHFGTHIDDAE